MGVWMNDQEIWMLKDRYRKLPVLRLATTFLYDFAILVNERSDGWSYWRSPSQAAERLMELIRSADLNARTDVTYEAFRKAIVPILAFCTKRKFPRPSLPEDDIHVEERRPGAANLDRAG